MKTLVVIILMLSAFLASHAQLKGVPFDEAISFEEAEEYTDEEMYGVLIKMEEDSVTAYTYIYEVKSKGYYDALKRLSGILEANNISRSADIEDSYFPSYVDESDYNEVVHILRMESGWIERTWYVYDDNWKIFMMGNDEIIGVVVAHNKQERFERERQQQAGRQNNLGSNAFGSPDSDRYETGGGLGNNPYSYGLGSRRARGTWPLPNMSGCDVTQKIEVTVEIQVDRDGNVLGTPTVLKATYQDKCIWDMVVEAAKKSKFTADQAAAYQQKGWIKYIIVP